MTKSQKPETEIAKIKVSCGAEFSGDEIALNFPHLLDFIKLDEGDFKDINRFLEELLEVSKLLLMIECLIFRVFQNSHFKREGGAKNQIYLVQFLGNKISFKVAFLLR